MPDTCDMPYHIVFSLFLCQWLAVESACIVNQTLFYVFLILGGGIFQSSFSLVGRKKTSADGISTFETKTFIFFSLPLIFGVNLNLQPMFSFYAVGAFYASVMLLLMMMLMKLA